MALFCLISKSDPVGALRGVPGVVGDPLQSQHLPVAVLTPRNLEPQPHEAEGKLRPMAASMFMVHWRVYSEDQRDASFFVLFLQSVIGGGGALGFAGFRFKSLGLGSTKFYLWLIFHLGPNKVDSRGILRTVCSHADWRWMYWLVKWIRRFKMAIDDGKLCGSPSE